MPQIGLVSPDLMSWATTTPAFGPCGAADRARGQALPVRLTQSTASSFVNRSARSNPWSVHARKLEQNRWKLSLARDHLVEPLSTPALCWLSASIVTSAFVKSFCEFASVGAAGVYGNGTVDVSWFT